MTPPSALEVESKILYEAIAKSVNPNTAGTNLMLTTAEDREQVYPPHEIAIQSRRYDLHHKHGHVRLYVLCARFWREEAADLVCCK